MNVTIEERTGTSYTARTIEVDTAKDFTIDQEDLEQAAADVVRQLVFYGELFAMAKASLIRKEESLKRIYAEVAIQFRADFTTKGEKVTEAKLEELVLTSPAYTLFQNDLFGTREEALKTEAWWRSIQQKCEMIKVIGYRQSAEIKKLY